MKIRINNMNENQLESFINSEAFQLEVREFENAVWENDIRLLQAKVDKLNSKN